MDPDQAAPKQSDQGLYEGLDGGGGSGIHYSLKI